MKVLAALSILFKDVMLARSQVDMCPCHAVDPRPIAAAQRSESKPVAHKTNSQWWFPCQLDLASLVVAIWTCPPEFWTTLRRAPCSSWTNAVIGVSFFIGSTVVVLMLVGLVAEWAEVLQTIERNSGADAADDCE